MPYNNKQIQAPALLESFDVCVSDANTLEDLLADLANMDLVFTPLFSPSVSPDELNINQLLDKCLITSDLSPIHDFSKRLCISLDPLRSCGEAKLRLLVGYCAYLGINKVSLTLNTKTDLGLLRSIIPPSMTIYLVAPLQEMEVFSWFLQERHHLLNRRVYIVLTLQVDVPQQWRAAADRWCSQNVGYLLLNEDAFTTNTKGFPVLTKKHQDIVTNLVERTNCGVGIRSRQSPSQSRAIEDRLDYLEFLYDEMLKKSSNGYNHARTLLNYPLNPLQPYADNLESLTYSIFEDDTKKYELYEEAIELALETFPKDQTVSIFYVGAGRGGILSYIMKAAKKTARNVTVLAVEKNPYPLQTLRWRIEKNRWTKQVSVVQADLKTFTTELKPDILVSQLLGAFGCNQLSPQCLQWAERLITPKTICIPQQYTSCARLVSNSPLYNAIENKQCYSSSYSPCSWGIHQTSELWKFTHPLDAGDHLHRNFKGSFLFNQRMLVSGLECTFHSKLYGPVFMSIVKESHTPNMLSWYPILMPFREEELVQKDQIVQVKVQRRGNQRSLWYEWSYQIFSKGIVRKCSLTHNKDGKVISIGM